MRGAAHRSTRSALAAYASGSSARASHSSSGMAACSGMQQGPMHRIMGGAGGLLGGTRGRAARL